MNKKDLVFITLFFGVFLVTLLLNHYFLWVYYLRYISLFLGIAYLAKWITWVLYDDLSPYYLGDESKMKVLVISRLVVMFLVLSVSGVLIVLFAGANQQYEFVDCTQYDRYGHVIYTSDYLNECGIYESWDESETQLSFVVTEQSDANFELFYGFSRIEEAIPSGHITAYKRTRVTILYDEMHRITQLEMTSTNLATLVDQQISRKYTTSWKRVYSYDEFHTQCEVWSESSGTLEVSSSTDMSELSMNSEFDTHDLYETYLVNNTVFTIRHIDYNSEYPSESTWGFMVMTDHDEMTSLVFHPQLVHYGIEFYNDQHLEWYINDFNRSGEAKIDPQTSLIFETKSTQGLITTRYSITNEDDSNKRYLYGPSQFGVWEIIANEQGTQIRHMSPSISSLRDVLFTSNEPNPSASLDPLDSMFDDEWSLWIDPPTPITYLIPGYLPFFQEVEAE